MTLHASWTIATLLEELSGSQRGRGVAICWKYLGIAKIDSPFCLFLAKKKVLKSTLKFLLSTKHLTNTTGSCFRHSEPTKSIFGDGRDQKQSYRSVTRPFIWMITFFCNAGYTELSHIGLKMSCFTSWAADWCLHYSLKNTNIIYSMWKNLGVWKKDSFCV